MAHHYAMQEQIMRERAHLPTYRESIEVTPYISVTLTQKDMDEKREKEERRTKRLNAQYERAAATLRSQSSTRGRSQGSREGGERPTPATRRSRLRGGSKQDKRGNNGHSGEDNLPKLSSRAGTAGIKAPSTPRACQGSPGTTFGSITRIATGSVTQSPPSASTSGPAIHCHFCDRHCTGPRSDLPRTSKAADKPFCSRNCVFLFESSLVPCFQCNKKCSRGVIPVNMPQQRKPVSFCSQACMIARINYNKSLTVKSHGVGLDTQLKLKRDRDRLAFGHRINGHPRTEANLQGHGEEGTASGGGGGVRPRPDLKSLNPRKPAISLLTQTWQRNSPKRPSASKVATPPGTERSPRPSRDRASRGGGGTRGQQSVRIQSRADTIPDALVHAARSGHDNGDDDDDDDDDDDPPRHKDAITNTDIGLPPAAPSSPDRHASRASWLSTEPDTPVPTPPPLGDVSDTFKKVQHYPYAAPFSEVVKRSLRPAPSRQSFAQTADPQPYRDALKAVQHARQFNPDFTQPIDTSKIKIKPFRRTQISTSYNANKLDGYGTFRVPGKGDKGAKGLSRDPRASTGGRQRPSSCWTPSDPYASLDVTHHRRRDDFTEYVNLTTMERNNARRFLDAKGPTSLLGMHHDRIFR